MKRTVPLEQAAEAVCDANAVPPLIFQLSPAEGRMVLEHAQNAPVYQYPAEIVTRPVDTGKWGAINLHLIKQKDDLSFACYFFIHGAGWVFGSCIPMKKLFVNWHFIPIHW